MDYPSIYNATVLTAESQARNFWISPISTYLRNKTLLEDKCEAVKVKARAAKYNLINGIMYRRSLFGPYQRCVPTDKVKGIID